MPASRADVCSGELSQCLQCCRGQRQGRLSLDLLQDLPVQRMNIWISYLGKHLCAKQASARSLMSHVSRMSHVAGRTAPATRAVQAVRGV